jgi:hypothetical protein
MTERGEFRFTVKEAGDGRPWIAAEPAGDSLTSLPGLLGFELRPGSTYEDAKTVASFMNLHIAGITHTQL